MRAFGGVKRCVANRRSAVDERNGGLMSAGYPFYSGASVHPHPGHGGMVPAYGGSGFCSGCSHPRTKCCCWIRECRKEAKELLVQADKSLGAKSEMQADILTQMKAMAPMLAHMDFGRTGESAGKDAGAKAALNLDTAAALEKGGSAGIGKAFIGGGCCVHLSIEYTPTNPASNLPAIVLVMVQDSESTVLAWLKQASAHDGYQIKEGIMTTKPGAHLTVLVLNMTARIRWCEVFSC